MDAEAWLASELASFACAACGQPYGEDQVRLIARREELFFVDLSCPHCGSQAVAIVTIQVDGETLRADTEEAIRETPDGEAGMSLAARPAVSVDDVIDAHVLLRDFEGDVHQLIARFQGRRP
jgi:DNA-directed RNA polymerase subunit RPC12/RpoP